MKVKGEDLIFISRISKDGKEIIPITKEDEGKWLNQIFYITSLSMSERTFIASGMSSFVVKRKSLISTSTNSELGSYHWFHTIVGSNKAIGEYLKTTENSITKRWGEILFLQCEELIKGYKYINKK